MSLKRPMRSRLFAGLLMQRSLAYAVAMLIVSVSILYWSRPSPKAYYHQSSAQSGSICGPVAVANVCRLAGKNVDMLHVMQMIERTSKGTTLNECARVLNALGVSAALATGSAATCIPNNGLAICAVRTRSGYHAVAVRREEDVLIVVDGALVSSTHLADFEGVFAGNAIIVAKKEYDR